MRDRLRPRDACGPLCVAGDTLAKALGYTLAALEAECGNGEPLPEVEHGQRIIAIWHALRAEIKEAME